MDKWNRNMYGKTPACCSYTMSVSEMDEERRQSGWNPYQGEEEETGTPQYKENPAAEGTLLWEEELAEPKAAERDLRMLQSMFPQAAKILIPHIMEACDKMEYEGSSMYDEYPDAETIRRIQDEIYRMVENQFPPQPQPERDEMLMMQVPGSRQNPPGQNWLKDLIRVLLLQEMHHRRCRYRGCRRPQPPRRPYPPRGPQPPRQPYPPRRSQPDSRY